VNHITIDWPAIRGIILLLVALGLGYAIGAQQHTDELAALRDEVTTLRTNEKHSDDYAIMKQQKRDCEDALYVARAHVAAHHQALRDLANGTLLP